jgi:hypothetical protein
MRSNYVLSQLHRKDLGARKNKIFSCTQAIEVLVGIFPVFPNKPPLPMVAFLTSAYMVLSQACTWKKEAPLSGFIA